MGNAIVSISQDHCDDLKCLAMEFKRSVTIILESMFIFGSLPRKTVCKMILVPIPMGEGWRGSGWAVSIHSGNPLTSAGSVQLDSDTTCLEMMSDPTGEGLTPTRLSPPGHTRFSHQSQAQVVICASDQQIGGSPGHSPLRVD